jgi:MAF protein
MTKHAEYEEINVESALNPAKLILASSSPRRKELLRLLGIPFTVVEPRVEEVVRTNQPELFVQELAIRKAQAFRGKGIIVAADTIVVFEDKILGKPADQEEAYKMLLLLQGKPHLVITGVAVATPESMSSSHCTTRLIMRQYSEEEARAYVSSGRAMDKAGAYAIQDADFNPVVSYEGCYLNVIGLPLCTLVRLLRKSGLPVENFHKPQECLECRAEDQL